MPATHEPRYADYQVVHAHTGEVDSTHSTRAQANQAKNTAADPALRVRGGETAVAYERRTGKKPGRQQQGWASRFLGRRR